MAEEEVLTEMAPAPKKEKGGGFTFVHLIIIAVVTAGIVAGGYAFLGSKFGSSTEQLGEQINNAMIRNRADAAFDDFKSIIDCDEVKGTTMSLSADGKAIIVNLADGEHYLSVGISVCVSEKVTPEVFEAKRPLILHISNEFLSMLTYDDLFPGKGGETADAAEEDTELSGLDFEEAAPSFAVKKDQVRAGLLNAFTVRKIHFVEEVYFTEFLVQ